MAVMSTPDQSDAERRDHAVFEALMWALAEPGRPHRLPEPGFTAMPAALLDLETSAFCSDPDLAETIARTGAIAASADQADYLFLPTVDAAALDHLRAARAGDFLYPNRAAMIFAGTRFGTGTQRALSGPGISGGCEVSLALPEAFWELRHAACRYPAGWDVVFLDGASVIGLPRSTLAEAV